jgi:hypothetical protein
MTSNLEILSWSIERNPNQEVETVTGEIEFRPKVNGTGKFWVKKKWTK